MDEHAFETIYNLYWEKIYAVCYNNIREMEPAREMVQDIFKSLWERRDTLELTATEHYLVRAAKLKTFEYLRNKVAREKHLAQVTRRSHTSTNCTEEQVIFNSLTEQLNTFVETLPRQCQRVYRMSREQGLSNREIASLLFISERAVEYHISRALKTLRTSLADFIH